MPVVVATVQQPELLLSVLIPYVAVAAAGIGAMVYLGHRTGAVKLRKLRIPNVVREHAPFIVIGVASGVVSSSAANFIGTHAFAMVLIGLVGAMISVMVYAVIRIVLDSARSGPVERDG